MGEQQRVEILKMLYRGVRILIMDEPTAVLAPQETEELFRTLRSMIASGHSIVFISHKLTEVASIANRITVMRRGRVTAAGVATATTTRTSLAELMVGRPVIEVLDRTPFKPGDVVLSVRDIEALNDRGLPALRGVSFDVRAGEILGIAGVAGNGQSELAQVITGLRPCRATSRSRVPRRPTIRPARRSGAGVAHVPEDRTGVGSAPNLSVMDNLIMKSYKRPPIARGWVVDQAAARRISEGLREGYQILTPSVDTAARLLSGGNLQRLILAREIDQDPSLLVAVQPTRGLDVGAIEGVHRLLLARRESGSATIMISEDLDEVLALSDRIAVMYEGHLRGPFSAAEVDAQGLGLLMTGGDWQPAASDDGSRAHERLAGPARPASQGAADALHGLARTTPRGAPLVLAHHPRRRAVALVISGLMIALVGGDPIRSYVHIVGAAFGSPGVISDTLVKATPLILAGLACALAFRMRLWNIGVEGQYLMGAWGATAVVMVPLVPADAPAPVMLVAMAIAGFLSGAIWGSIPGLLKAYLKVNEIIVTLMLNYIALLFIQYWVFGPWSEGGFQMTRQFPRTAWLPRLSDFAASVPAFGGLTIHAGFLVALLAATIVWLVVRRSRWGFVIQLVGDSPNAARYAGVNIKRDIVLVFMASGGLAGLAGMSEVAGAVHRLQDTSPGYGFTAIIVAYLARFNPLGVVVAAILFAALILAGREIQPSGIPAMVQGIVLFCVIASDVLRRYSVRVQRAA